MRGNTVHRNLPAAGFVSLLLLLLLPCAASAVEIDDELKEILATKDTGIFPVLMIYHDPVTLDDLEAELNGLNPQKRRKRVVAELKKRGRKVQTNAAAILDSPLFEGQARNVRYLYLASAVSFDGTRGLVEALGGLEDNATLFYNRGYDFLTATQRGVNQAGPSPDKGSADVVDTVWSTRWINADRVWNELGLDGTGVVVGHIDSGVDLAHPDLATNLAINSGEVPNNGLDDDLNGYVDDVIGWDFGDGDQVPDDDSAVAGHGTHTAGTVVGNGFNGTLTGVAPGARLVPCKVAHNDGSMTFGAVWEAQQYLLERGVQVITMSLGAAGDFSPVYMRTERAIADNIRAAGVVFFNSAANSHYEYDPPEELGLTARVPSPWVAPGTPFSQTGGVITVGGTGYQSDGIYPSGSRGPARWDNVDPYYDWPYNPGDGLIKPDVAAPGMGVNSTVLGGGYSGNTWSGTSMACPHVAGVAALMLQKNISLSPAGVDSILQTTAVDLGAVGKDNDFGSGRVDALAAVQAVPLTIRADLLQTEVIPDPAGDGVLDPGEVATVAFQLVNASQQTDAHTVTATLAVVNNPYVTVVDSEAVFPDVVAGGTKVDNTGDPFSLSVDPATPQGYTFTMLLTVASGENFERTFDATWYVGLPEFRTHDRGGIYLTVTDQGSIGFMSQDGSRGDGMGLSGQAGGLFLGSFWAGTGVDYICNRDYTGVDPGVETMEWEVVTEPNGRVRDLSTAPGEQVFGAIFSDSGHQQPRSLVVQQKSFAPVDGLDSRFVILEYTLTNGGATAMAPLYTGVFCDFDLGDAGLNVGDSNSDLNLVYLNAADDVGPFFGVALLGSAGTATNLTVINNYEHVFVTSSIDDATKMGHLDGTQSQSASILPADYSVLVSKALALPAAGGTGRVAYILAAGETLAELEAAVMAAHEAFFSTADVEDGAPRTLVQLAQNHPNPFNPITRIAFGVPATGHVELGVYDLGGRLVRTLVSETRPAGDHTVTWDGRDAQGNAAPSGLYFYRLETGGQVISRKMTLVK